MITINGSTTLLGIIGDPVAHTASPAMHNAAFQQLGLNYAYVPLHVRAGDLGRSIEAIRTLHFRGFNVTVPHKETVIPYLDDLDPLAKAIGAVNTIIRIENRLVGYNTDAPGFLSAIQHEIGMGMTGKKVAIIGAGGTAKALAVALSYAGVSSLGIVNRSIKNAEGIAASVSEKCHAVALELNSKEMAPFLRECAVVVNTTSVGMSAGESPVHRYDWVQKDMLVCDVIYSPQKTEFLVQSEGAGALILNGVGMLAAQGMLAFELFTGKPISYDFMKTQILKKRAL